MFCEFSNLPCSCAFVKFPSECSNKIVVCICNPVACGALNSCVDAITLCIKLAMKKEVAVGTAYWAKTGVASIMIIAGWPKICLSNRIGGSSTSIGLPASKCFECRPGVEGCPWRPIINRASSIYHRNYLVDITFCHHFVKSQNFFRSKFFLENSII